MPAGFELLEEAVFGPGGSFIPQAPQKQFRSAFACVEGEKKLGWEDEQSMIQGRTSQDGKAKLVYQQWKDDKGKVNEVKYQGMRLREFVVPVEDALKMDAYAAKLSAIECSKVTAPSSTPATPNSIGRLREAQDGFTHPSAVNFTTTQ